MQLLNSRFDCTYILFVNVTSIYAYPGKSIDNFGSTYAINCLGFGLGTGRISSASGRIDLLAVIDEALRISQELNTINENMLHENTLPEAKPYEQ
jgi:hypothetical protein